MAEPVPVIIQIEDAMVAAIKAQCKDEDGDLYLATCRVFDGGDDLDSILDSARRMPGILVAYDGCEPLEQVTRRDWRVEMNFNVLIVDKSSRRSLAAKRGIFGTLRMVEDVRTALISMDLGFPALNGFGWPSEETLALGGNVSALGLTFPVVMEVRVALTRDPADENEWLERIGLAFGGREGVAMLEEEES